MGSAYFFVGDAGVILKREEGVYSAKTSGTSAKLTAIWGLRGGPIYAGGLGVLLRSDDDGETWTDQSSAAGLDAQEVVTQIHGTAANRVYVATYGYGGGSDGRLLMWNGSAWSERYPLASADAGVTGCWAFGDTDIWIAQIVAGDDLTKHYTGSWAVTPDGAPGGPRFFGLATNDLYQNGSGGGSQTSVRHWNGSAWSTVYEPGQKCAYAIHGSHAENVVVVESVFSDGRFRAHRFDGEAWAEEYTGALDTVPTGVAVPTLSEAVASLEDGRVYVYEDETWTLEGSDLTGTTEHLNGVWSPGDEDGPIVIDAVPGAGARDVSPRTPIAFIVTDLLSEVDLTSLRFRVNGALIYDGASFVAGWTGSTIVPASGNAVVVLDHPALTGRIVHLEVVASDTAGNESTIRWAFLLRAPAPRLGDCFFVGDGKDLAPDSDGHLQRDGVASRCRARVLTRRGHWALAPAFGSRLHEIQLTKGAYRKARDAIEEALWPLLEEGAIKSVRVESIADAGGDHVVAVQVLIVVPGGDVETLGEVPLR